MVVLVLYLLFYEWRGMDLRFRKDDRSLNSNYYVGFLMPASLFDNFCTRCTEGDEGVAMVNNHFMFYFQYHKDTWHWKGYISRDSIQLPVHICILITFLLTHPSSRLYPKVSSTHSCIVLSLSFANDYLHSKCIGNRRRCCGIVPPFTFISCSTIYI